MSTLPVCFDAEQFNRLFPFHIRLSRNRQILSTGPSLAKLGTLNTGSLFDDHCKILRPQVDLTNDANALLSLSGQLVTIQLTDTIPLVLRGQFEYMPANDCLLFLGAPWMTTIDLLASYDLCLNDFAVFDPTIDLLQLLKTKDMAHDDIKELLRIVNIQRDKIKQQEEKYRRIIANMNLGMVEVDLQNNIQYVNQRFCSMSGYECDELLGRNAEDLFLNGRFRELMNEVDKRRAAGQSDAYEIQVTLKNGDTRWWLISGAPLYNKSGDVVGSTGIHLDITDQKILQQQLEAAKKEAESSATAKQHFLANMSHEIRTPMNAILGMSRQLQKTFLSPQQKSFLKIISDASENLLVIINDILDLSKIDAGKVTLEAIGFNLDDLVRNSAHLLLHKAEEKGLQLTVEVSDQVSPVLLGDPFRINQLIMNLLGNAIKFTTAGNIGIQCTVSATCENMQVVELIVSDTGKGMDEAFVKNLFFSKFSQEDESIARSYGGTGLGMSIVKQLVELMNGSITVNSKKGKGTRIKISLPLTIGSTLHLPVKETAAADGSLLTNKKILLVEDNEMNRCVAETILSEYGVQITEAVNGAAAVEAVTSEQFDVILMDMQMPVMDGIKATRIIRSDINPSVPIIALTANAVKGEMEKCLQAGMNDYISKPFYEEELIRIISKWIA